MVEGLPLRRDEYHLLIRDDPDGVSVGVIPLTYGRARIVIFRTGTEETYDDFW